MEVNPNASANAVPRPTGKPPVTSKAAPRTDSVSLRGTEAIDSALQQVPDVRTEAVTKAAMLVGDVKYPPLQTINAISNLLAMNLDQQNQ